MKAKYRIVTDRYAGFEAQYKTKWFPFWRQCFGVNTGATIERAGLFCDKHANHHGTVEYYEPKPITTPQPSDVGEREGEG